MYFYHHLLRGSKQYVERPDGLPVIYQESITIPVIAGQPDYQFTDGVRLLTQYVAVGLWVIEPSTAGAQLLTEKLTNVSRAIFDSAYLTLKDNTARLLDKTSLRLVEKANANGLPFYLTPRGFVNLAESQLDVYNNAGIAADTAIRIMVDYVIPTGKHYADLIHKNK